MARCSLNTWFREGDAEMIWFTQLIIVHFLWKVDQLIWGNIKGKWVDLRLGQWLRLPRCSAPVMPFFGPSGRTWSLLYETPGWWTLAEFPLRIQLIWKKIHKIIRKNQQFGFFICFEKNLELEQKFKSVKKILESQEKYFKASVENS